MNSKDVDKYLNGIKPKDAMQDWLTHDAVTLSANTSTTVIISVPSQYDFQWFTLQSKQTGVYSLQFHDAGGTYFSNKPLHSSAVCGNGDLPYKLPFPYLLQRRGSVIFDIADLSGSSNTIQITLGGIQYYNEKIAQRILAETINKIPYIYTLDDTPVSVGTTDTAAKITIDKTHDFLMKKISYKDNNSSTSLQMKMQHSSGMGFQNDKYLDVKTIFGNAQYPYEFQHPTPVYGGNVITLTFKDSSTNTLYMAFGGIVRSRGVK